MNQFVSVSKNAMWCPGKDCGLVCYSKDGKPVNIYCHCGTNFCFGCKKSAHDPISCKMRDDWMKKVGMPTNCDLRGNLSE